MKTIRLFVMLAVFSTLSLAQAWGPLGHQVTGQVAEQMLLPQTKQKLRQLLQNQTLPEVVNWADTIKQNPDWKFASWYHFENIHDNEAYLQSIKDKSPDEQKRGGMVTGMLEAEKIYLSNTATDLEKQNAVKFLVHFIGDAHQPLHSGRVEDKGGNTVMLKWNGQTVNLHQVWDTYIINEGHPDFVTNAKPVAVYADYLQKKFKNLSPDQGQLDNMNTWIQESMTLRNGLYQYYNKENESQYTQRFIDGVDQRLYLAGVRMAAFLNQMVSKGQQPAVRMSFRQAIEDLTGPISSYISLKL